MENIKNVEGGVSPLAAFEAMPEPELRSMVEEMLTSEEKVELTDKDFQMILNVARRYLEKERAQTIEDAVAIGTIARTEAVKIIGKPIGGVFVQDREGKVITSGPNKISAMKNAQEIAREQ